MQKLGLSGGGAGRPASVPESLDRPQRPPLAVEYDPRVLDDIRAHVSGAFERIAPSGFETAGVLFGTHSRRGVTVTAMRPAGCAYASGPVFVLGPNDHQRFQEVVSLHQIDPELQGLEPVGWFLSHVRDSLVLRPSDREIFDRYFDQTWHVVLVIRPGRTGSLRAATMARGAEDDILLKDFTIRQAKDLQIPATAEPAAPRVEATFVPVKMVPAVEAVPSRKPAQLTAAPSPPVQRTRKWLPWASAAAVLVIAALAAAVYLRTHSPDNLALEATDRNGIMYIEWNPDSRMISRANRAELEIFDGDQRVEKNLGKADLKRGVFVTVRKRPDLTARLRLYDENRMIHDELTRYAGWPVIKEDPSAAKLRDLESENSDLRTKLTKERRRADELARRVEKLERRTPNRRRR